MKKDQMYAILYKREVLYEDYVIFLPCHYICGDYDLTDKSITDKAGYPFYCCDNYDIVTSIIDLTYYYDITSSDLKNMYQTSDINDALNKYYESIKKNLLIGRVNTKAKMMELTSLSYEAIEELMKSISYTALDEKKYVTLNKVQLQDIYNQSSIEIIKRKIKQLLDGIKMLDKCNEIGINSIMTNPTGKNVIIQKPQKNIQDDMASSVISIQYQNNDNICKKAYDYVSKRLVGQDDAVKDLISVVINNMNAVEPKEIIKPLVIGPTGSGKTYLFKLLSQILDIPVITVDCNLLVQSGYEGQNIEDVLKQLYVLCGNDKSKTERAIVFLDEIDKLANAGAGVSDVGVQKALLKFIEGHKYVIELDRMGSEKITIDTSMMSIVSSGAFAMLTASKKIETGFIINNATSTENKKITFDQIIESGMIPELVGRFGLIVQYNNVNEEMIMEQLYNGLESPLKINERKFLRNYGIKIQFSDAYISRICKESIKKQSGFRGVDQMVNDSLIKLSFELQYNSIGERMIVITDEFIDNPKKYIKKWFNVK